MNQRKALEGWWMEGELKLWIVSASDSRPCEIADNESLSQ